MIHELFLTRRERQVYELREEGLDNEAVAARLGISRANASMTYHNARRRIAKGIPATQVRRGGPNVWRETWLKPEDVVACRACGLRGHREGDPERCWPAARRAATSPQLGGLAKAISDQERAE